MHGLSGIQLIKSAVVAEDTAEQHVVSVMLKTLVYIANSRQAGTFPSFQSPFYPHLLELYDGHPEVD